jgi:hypothetical protein
MSDYDAKIRQKKELKEEDLTETYNRTLSENLCPPGKRVIAAALVTVYAEEGVPNSEAEPQIVVCGIGTPEQIGKLGELIAQTPRRVFEHEVESDTFSLSNRRTSFEA